MWTGLIWLKLWGLVVGYYVHGNEPSGSMKGGELNKRLTDCLSRKPRNPMSS